ncbi:MAG: cysteine--tRNA ligase [Bacteroidetes bacterium]|nr:cysteine--tRNA ligase [Bacteroidota bacterium]
MQIRLYTTMDRDVREFHPIDPNDVRIYSCGPTVYDVAHIGNMRSFLSMDLLQRVLRTVGGYKVRWVMNITDIDDKTIDGSRVGSARWLPAMGTQTGDVRENLRAFTTYYEDVFRQDITTLGIQPSDFYAMPRATDFIAPMMDLIKDIVAAGFGYVSDGSVYFNVNAYRKHYTYGRLFTIDVEHFREGVRIDADEYDRESVSDFVLWKGRKEGEPSWDLEIDGVPLPGRPGWHIECSAMSKELLGLPFDIHTGGVDLRFPHHEDEIAQCCAGYHVQEQANYWMHNEFLEIEGKKMSKSLGNFFTLRDLLDREYDPLDIRFAMIGSHYRALFNFTIDGLAASVKARERVQDYIYDLADVMAASVITEHRPSVHSLRTSVFAELADDLHTPKALAALFSFMNDHKAVTLSASDAEIVLGVLQELNNVFAVWSFGPRPAVVVPDDVTTLAEQRWAARAEKNWAESDRLRDAINALGWSMMDGKTSYTLEKL